MNMNILRDIRDMALRDGADFFGIADLAPARNAIVAQGGDSLAAFTRAVSIGIALPNDVVDRLVQHDNPVVAREYWDVYVETNRNLDRIAASVADRLRDAGASALAVPASRRIDHDRLRGLFSHKMAAHLAGLGWIGKSCLLVTRQAGPRARWATVLTNAPLPPTGGPTEPACGECRQCVEACPAQAFTGMPFRAEDPLEVRFAAQKCEDHVNGLAQKMGCRVLCGLCMAICPHGKHRPRVPLASPPEPGTRRSGRGSQASKPVASARAGKLACHAGRVQGLFAGHSISPHLERGAESPMAGRNSRNVDYTLSAELPEIHPHSNTQYCPLIYELIPAHGCSFECEYCNVYNLKAESCFYPITVFKDYPDLVEKTVVVHQADGVDPVYYFSPKTDVFQPALVETGVTRRILEILARAKARYILVTKGKLPGPDILDLLVRSGGAGRVLVSYGMKNQAHADVLEPFAATLEERFELATLCTRNGVPAMGVIEPILPLQDLSFVEQIIRKFVEIGVDHFAVDFARISLACLDKLVAKLPELAELNDIYRSPEAISQNFGTGPYKREAVERFAPSAAYLHRTFNQIEAYAKKQNATISICNYFPVPGINLRAYERGFLCFGIYDKERAAQYAIESRKCAGCRPAPEEQAS